MQQNSLDSVVRELKQLREHDLPELRQSIAMLDQRLDSTSSLEETVKANRAFRERFEGGLRTIVVILGLFGTALLATGWYLVDSSFQVSATVQSHGDQLELLREQIQDLQAQIREDQREAERIRREDRREADRQGRENEQRRMDRENEQNERDIGWRRQLPRQVPDNLP
jgi:transposase